MMEQDDQEVVLTKREHFMRAVKLVLHIALYGSVLGSTSLMYWAVRAKQPWTHYQGAERNLEPIKYVEDVPFVYHLSFDTAFFGYLPTCFLIYISATWKQVIPCVLTVGLSYVVFAIYRGITSSNFIYLVLSVAPFISFVACLKFLLPRRSKVPKHAMFQSLVLIVGVVFLQMLRSFPTNTIAARLFMVLIVLPCIKEIMSTVVRTSSNYMTLDMEVGGGVVVDRSRTWWFFLYAQIFTAYLIRMFFTNFSDKLVLTAVVSFQSAYEIAMRLSLSWRDRKIRTMLLKLRRNKNRRNTVVVLPTMTSTHQHRSQADSPTSVLGTDKPEFSSKSMKVSRNRPSPITMTGGVSHSMKIKYKPGPGAGSPIELQESLKFKSKAAAALVEEKGEENDNADANNEELGSSEFRFESGDISSGKESRNNIDSRKSSRKDERRTSSMSNSFKVKAGEARRLSNQLKSYVQGPPQERRIISFNTDVTKMDQWEIAASLQEAEEAKLIFRTSVILGEMIAEYVAIFTIPFIIILNEDFKLGLPLDFYSSLDNPFTQPIDRWDLFQSTMIQFTAELIADLICVYVESMSGHRLTEVWNGRHKWFFLMFALCANHASSIVSIYITHTDNFAKCQNKNMCYCACGNGLYLGGIREEYCLLVYPEWNGVPDESVYCPLNGK